MKTKNHNSYSQYLEIVKILARIKRFFNADEIKFSPFLHIGKAVPENLTIYIKLLKSAENFNSYVYKSRFLFKFLQCIFVPIMHHIYRYNEFKSFNSKIPKNVNTVFVSHFTHKRLDKNKYDLFFGTLPYKKSTLKSRNLILMINHTKISSVKLNNQNNANVINPIKIYLPKTTSNKSFAVLYLRQIKFFLKISREANKISKTKLSQKIFMYELALHQISQSIFMQNCLLANLLDVCDISQPQKIMLTFEGHSYETFIARKISKKFNNIIIGLYQFSPLVFSQHAFFENVRALPKKAIIYVSGKRALSQIVDRSGIDKKKVIVLGSFKNSDEDINLTKKNKILTVILAPEASEHSLREFLRIYKYCKLYLPKIEFILRPHPASAPFAMQVIIKYLHYYPAYLKLGNSLEFDLKKANVCIYRSSVVGLQGLQYGVFPIHYSCMKNGAIDPIDFIDLKHPRVNSIISLIKTLETFQKKFISRRTYSNVELKRVFNMYLQPINKEINV